MTTNRRDAPTSVPISQSDAQVLEYQPATPRRSAQQKSQSTDGVAELN